MTTLIEQLINKMGLRDEPHVLEKTTELVRLLELRSTNVPLQINEYGKIVVCVDIAAGLLDIPFDKEQALKLASLRKSHYANNKRMFEKLLDLNKLVTVSDICVQLSLNEVAKKAEELIELYRRVVASENPDIDIAHPQYAAMAVFQACILLKIKVPKTKLMPFSNLRPTQWQQLQQRWDNMLLKHYKATLDNKLMSPNSKDLLEPAKKQKPSDWSKASKKNEVEDYEKWKQRILAVATEELKRQKTADTPLEES